MRVERLADGLWRWTAPEADTGREGNALYHEAPDGIVLIDPLLPDDADQAERFWRALDRDVERIGLPPLVALTDAGRRTGAELVRARYAGSRVVASGGGEGDRALADGAILPGEVEVLVAEDGPGEPRQALLGCACHGLIWTGALLEHDAANLAPLLPRLLALGPRFLVGAHGEPVVEDAAEALARALA